MMIRKEHLINVSDLNQFLYCPRRYWYLHFFDTQGRNVDRISGKMTHQSKADRGGWFNELYLESEAVGLKGKIDVLEAEGDELVPIERKRATSGRYFHNDEVQLAGYCMLLEEHLGDPVDEGIIYLYETDQRHRIRITDSLREEVMNAIADIRDLSITHPPPLVDNPNKCERCSTREYCLPEETARLEPEQVAGTEWVEYL